MSLTIGRGHTQTQRGYKRPLDLSILILSHLLFLPFLFLLWLLIPLAIWLEDRGPIFYSQKRVGKGGRIFSLYKFRSMRVGAEVETGPVWASVHDPRVTHVGRLLRSRALDELPQIWNVLKGEMSLVGPRPERPELVEGYHLDPERLQIPPGITGLAQIYGGYQASPRNKLRYDRLYMRRMSPLVDIQLLALSVAISLLSRWQS